MMIKLSYFYLWVLCSNLLRSLPFRLIYITNKKLKRVKCSKVKELETWRVASAYSHISSNDKDAVDAWMSYVSKQWEQYRTLNQWGWFNLISRKVTHQCELLFFGLIQEIKYLQLPDRNIFELNRIELGRMIELGMARRQECDHLNYIDHITVVVVRNA